jgi:hypothetical protein
MHPAGRGSSPSDSSFGNTRSINFAGRFSSSLRALAFTSTEYLATQLAACDQPSLDLRQRDPTFAPPRPRDQHIRNVFPKRLVCLQVDHRRHLRPLLIRQELYPAHGNPLHPSVPNLLRRFPRQQPAIPHLLVPGELARWGEHIAPEMWDSCPNSSRLSFRSAAKESAFLLPPEFLSTPQNRAKAVHNPPSKGDKTSLRMADEFHSISYT